MAQAIGVLFFAIGVMDIVLGIEDHCSLNTFQEAGNDMHFTKEATNDEFAIVGKFKGLHCCAKGYRSIEWYKDDKMYPWELDLSRLIIYPESANQTIYTPNIRQEDQGRYTCVLRNDTVVHTHTITLTVFDKLPDDLKMTYVPQSRQAYVGEHLRLFCEAFAGRVDTPDPNSAAVWYKKLENGTLTDVSTRLHQEKVSREEGQTFGTYLVFPGVHPDDYGVYTCELYKPGASNRWDVTLSEKVKVIAYIDHNPFPLKEIVLGSIIVGLILITVLIIYKQFALRVQVYLKDRFSTLEDDDGKQHDVLVAYSPKDSELASGVLAHTLENRGYVCQKKELSLDISNWNAELVGHIECCRRIITVISPASVNDSWVSSNLYQALKQLQSLNEKKMICVALKDLPTSQNETKNSIGETLASVAHSMNIITWHRSSDDNFWLRLYKELPPKRTGLAPVQPQRPRLTSERSFDGLMVA